MILTALSGCAPWGDYPDIEGWEILSNKCRVVFTPDVAIEDEVTEAAEEWGSATGCDMSVSPNGIPVLSVDSVWGRGPDQLGATWIYWNSRLPGRWKITRVEIGSWMDSDSAYKTILHEMAHVLGSGHVYGSVTIGEKVNADYIDELALESVCREIKCR